MLCFLSDSQTSEEILGNDDKLNDDYNNPIYVFNAESENDGNVYVSLPLKLNTGACWAILSPQFKG